MRVHCPRQFAYHSAISIAEKRLLAMDAPPTTQQFEAPQAKVWMDKTAQQNNPVFNLLQIYAGRLQIERTAFLNTKSEEVLPARVPTQETTLILERYLQQRPRPPSRESATATASDQILWEENRLKSFLHDPSLQNAGEVQSAWIDFVKLKRNPQNAEDVLRAKIRICRNLWIQRLPITPENVRAECERIVEDQASNASLSLFKNRSIAYIAHWQKVDDHRELSEADRQYYNTYRGGNQIFGVEPTLQSIRRQQGSGKTFSLVRPDKDVPSQIRAKTEFLKQVVELPPPLTVVFDGHGTDEDGSFVLHRFLRKDDVLPLEERIVITAKEFADALKKRHERYGHAEPEIVVSSSCLSSNFVRDVYEHQKDTGPSFTSVVAAEYGQSGYYDTQLKCGSKFWQDVLDVNYEKDTTIGTVMENQRKDWSHICVYTPVSQGRFRQIIQAPDGFSKRSG